MTITKTNFVFSSQTNVYHGKVRDVYDFGNTVAMVATDRLSAFDVILPKGIPYKGQVLNQLASYFLQQVKDIVPIWLRNVPDPNVSMGVKAEPVKVEVIVRGALVGSAWRAYEKGVREICGVPIPDGMKEFDAFEAPIITPTTKADAGHDEDVSAEQLIKNGLATSEEWQAISSYALAIFKRGQELAAKRGLLLADTKYEFGRLNGEIILIDEIHTPDSSRYFYKDGYEDFVKGVSAERPAQLSKEFVREWLMSHGFSGQDDEVLPELSEEFIAEISTRYIELYELLTGQIFVPDVAADPLARIEKAIEETIKNSGDKL